MRFGQGLGKKRITKGTVLGWLEKDGCPEEVTEMFKEFIAEVPRDWFETLGPEVGYKVQIVEFYPEDRHIEGLFFNFKKIMGTFVDISLLGCTVHFGKIGVNCSTPQEAAEKFTFFIGEVQKENNGKSRKRSKRN